MVRKGAGLQPARVQFMRRGFMSLRRTLLLAAIISVAPTAVVFAQTDPQNDPTSPSSASSPHQREATSNKSPEASSTDSTQGTNPSAASTPHQQQATGSSRTVSQGVLKGGIG